LTISTSARNKNKKIDLAFAATVALALSCLMISIYSGIDNN